MGNLAAFVMFLALGVVNGFPTEDLIDKLPGQPKSSIRQFGGFIDVTETRSLYYYFAEAKNDPATRPLTLWLTGGPTCSSVGDGFLAVGPFSVTANGNALEDNIYSWNNVSNLLFVDSPITAGYSYSTNLEKDKIRGDKETTDDLLAFMLKWYEKFPALKSQGLYLAGNSYGGHFTVNLGKAMLDYNKQSKGFKINLKGVALGNPVIRFKEEKLATLEVFLSHGMIPEEQYLQTMKDCNATNNQSYDSINLLSPACQASIDAAKATAFKINNVTIGMDFDIYRDHCNEEAAMDSYRAGKEYKQYSYGLEMCSTLRTDFYFNIPGVQNALHGDRPNLKNFTWKGCDFTSSKLNYSNPDKFADMIPIIEELVKQKVSYTVFSGDLDSVVPVAATRRHFQKMAADLNLQVTKPFRAWAQGNEIGGWQVTYGDLLTFVTVKGANHHVPFSKPAAALSVFTEVCK